MVMKKTDVILDIVREVVGPEVVPVVKVLIKRRNLSEFKLAELIKLEINVTRHLLYKLYDMTLVSFVRKKDKKKGWYIYYWTFNDKRVKEIAESALTSKVDRLKERLERERSSQFYMCKNKCMRLDFDQSSDFGFKCPECGELLDFVDNSSIIRELEKQIVDLQQMVVAPGRNVVVKKQKKVVRVKALKKRKKKRK